jgi:hypothetical protein
MANDDDGFGEAFGIAIVGGMGPILVAGLLVPLRDEISNANVALLLMVVVVAAAAVAGRTAAAVGAVVATLSFDFFHTEPYGSLAIDTRDDVETAAFLLLGGLIVGQLATRAIATRAVAARRQSEIRRIYRLAEQVAAGIDTAKVVDTACRELVELLGLESCRFERAPFTTTLPHMGRSGVVEPPEGQLITHSRFARDGFELPAGGVELPVRTRGHVAGRFVLEPRCGVGVSLEQRIVAVAVADQVGAALDGGTPSPPDERS